MMNNIFFFHLGHIGFKINEFKLFLKKVLDNDFLNGNMSTIIVHLSEHLNTAINLRSLAFQSEVRRSLRNED
jgi:hypothetical protein